jgi:hypothetical protein
MSTDKALTTVWTMGTLENGLSTGKIVFLVHSLKYLTVPQLRIHH